MVSFVVLLSLDALWGLQLLRGNFSIPFRTTAYIIYNAVTFCATPLSSTCRPLLSRRNFFSIRQTPDS